MTMLRSLLAPALILLCAGCATIKHDHAESVNGTAIADSTPAWKSLDTDDSGQLTRDELQKERAMVLLQEFDAADVNNDRAISREEWDAWWPTMAAPIRD